MWGVGVLVGGVCVGGGGVRGWRGLRVEGVVYTVTSRKIYRFTFTAMHIIQCENSIKCARESLQVFCCLTLQTNRVAHPPPRTRRHTRTVARTQHNNPPDSLKNHVLLQGPNLKHIYHKEAACVRSCVNCVRVAICVRYY